MFISSIYATWIHVMGYVDTGDTSQNICTWKQEIRLWSLCVCIYTHTDVCILFFKDRIHCSSLCRHRYSLRTSENQTTWKHGLKRLLAGQAIVLHVALIYTHISVSLGYFWSHPGWDCATWKWSTEETSSASCTHSLGKTWQCTEKLTFTCSCGHPASSLPLH